MRKTFVLSLLSCMSFVQLTLGQATADTLSVDLKSIDVNAPEIIFIRAWVVC